jgi:hypothetical protein
MALMPAPDYATEIAALERGLGSGEARIESDGESVTYRGVADIMRAIDYFTQRAAPATAPVGVCRPASTIAVYDPR